MKPFTFSSALFYILVIFYCFLGLPTSLDAQSTDNEVFNLNWELEDNDTLRYEVSMKDNQQKQLAGNLEKMIAESSDTLEAGKMAEINELLAQLRQEQVVSRYEATLTNSTSFDDVIDIVLNTIPDPKEPAKDSLGVAGQLISALTQGVMLRGSINKLGSVHSFWINKRQKNLLSLLFELPEKPVRIGEKWSLKSLTPVSADQSFICNHFERRNEVVITEIISFNGEKIAVIEYNILEHIVGTRTVMELEGDGRTTKETSVKASFKGQGKFSLDKGYMVSFDGIMATDVKGLIDQSSQQRITLKKQEL